VLGPAMGHNRCPRGDSCENAGSQTLEPSAGFGLRGGNRPAGLYQVLVPGCRDVQGRPAPTAWGTVAWDSDVPANTSLVMYARSGPSTDLTDPAWGTNRFTSGATQSPLCLQGGVLDPNAAPAGPATAADGVLLVEFNFKTQAQNATPRLKSLSVTWTCPK
jgi:hypothetical protein